MRVLNLSLSVLLLFMLPAYSVSDSLRRLRGNNDGDGPADEFGPVRRDDDGRIRGDLEPFDCSGKYQDEVGWDLATHLGDARRAGPANALIGMVVYGTRCCR